MKVNNKQAPTLASIITPHSGDSGASKGASRGFSFTFNFLKCVDLLILYEKLSTTPAKEIKRLAMEEVKKELRDLGTNKGKTRKDK